MRLHCRRLTSDLDRRRVNSESNSHGFASAKGATCRIIWPFVTIIRRLVRSGICARSTVSGNIDWGGDLGVCRNDNDYTVAFNLTLLVQQKSEVVPLQSTQGKQLLCEMRRVNVTHSPTVTILIIFIPVPDMTYNCVWWDVKSYSINQ